MKPLPAIIERVTSDIEAEQKRLMKSIEDLTGIEPFCNRRSDNVQDHNSNRLRMPVRESRVQA